MGKTGKTEKTDKTDKTEKTVNSHCQAFQQAIEVLGRPWTALLLNVLQAGPLRFSALAAAAQGPGDKVLSARLKELEEHGLLVRQVEPGPPVRVAYQLTNQGHAFGEVASAIEKWGRCLPSAQEGRRKFRKSAA